MQMNRLSQTVKVSSTVALERRFGRSCLPLTMALASRFGAVIVKKLDVIHAEWPFEDRMLVWMLPTLERDAVSYHRTGSSAHDMAAMFADHQLEHIDEALEIELRQRLDS